MAFKIGDKVKIIRILTINGDIITDSDFDKFIGKIGKIIRINEGSIYKFNLELKNGTEFFQENEMEIVKETLKSLLE